MGPETLHSNLKLLSHSSLLTLHGCPRRYELTKLLYRVRDTDASLDFGKIVGIGVQTYMITKSRAHAYLHMLAAWSFDLDNDSQSRNKKTFWYALQALDTFISHAKIRFANFELAYLRNVAGDLVPATEVGFAIDCGDGFLYRGFVDMVFVDKLRKEIVILEIKTTGAKVLHEAMYKNSGQALGYSVILDIIVDLLELEESSSYKVIYPVYQTWKEEWEMMEFSKSHTQRAVWIRSLLLDREHIQQYGAIGFFPMYGESCMAWNKPCRFFGICEMRNDLIVGGDVEPEIEDLSKYQFHFTIQELVEGQLAKYGRGEKDYG